MLANGESGLLSGKSFATMAKSISGGANQLMRMAKTICFRANHS
jgi:hypothetical protein